MTLKGAEFQQFRKKALVDRRERNLASTNSVIETIPEIAAALKTSQQFNGKYIREHFTTILVGHGRTHALLSGQGTKKRKLNDISGGPDSVPSRVDNVRLLEENKQLKASVASFQAEIALLK